MSSPIKPTTWKDGHPGVPRKWTQIGAGGNAIVWFDGEYAVKRLNPSAGTESKARFQREAEILKSLQGIGDLSVVRLIEVREREQKTEIVMERLDGNLESVIQIFSGLVEKTAAALIPIGETLEKLYCLENRIFHRDIKPANILFRASEDHLFLSDFGCAFLAEDERLTPDRRAVGAWAYRAPEYSVGALQEVDEKGDVFSMGKVLWAMIYGQRGMVFPGPVWFDPAYDLAKIYLGNPKMHHAMLLISKAAMIDPRKRPTMGQFVEGLRGLAQSSEADSSKPDLVEILRAESKIDVDHQQQRALTATFVRAIHSDLHAAIDRLHLENPDVEIWKSWYDEATRTPQTAASLVEQVADSMSDAPVVNARSKGYALTTRFYPVKVSDPASFKATVTNENFVQGFSELTLVNGSIRIVVEVFKAGNQSQVSSYSADTILEFLKQATISVLVGR